MRYILPKLFGLLLAILSVPSGYAAASGPVGVNKPALVSSIQTSSGTDRSRIVIILSEKPDYRLNPALSPLSLQIELNGVVLSPVLPQFLPVNDGRVKGIESFQYGKTDAKVTIGLEPGSDYRVSFKDEDGFVMLIDVAAKKAPNGASSGDKAPR